MPLGLHSALPVACVESHSHEFLGGACRGLCTEQSCAACEPQAVLKQLRLPGIHGDPNLDGLERGGVSYWRTNPAVRSYCPASRALGALSERRRCKLCWRRLGLEA